MVRKFEIPPELVRTIAFGQCVLFAGAGLSRHTNGLATWGEFIQNIRQAIEPHHGDVDDTNDGHVAAYPLEYLEYAKQRYRPQYAAAVRRELSTGTTDVVQEAHRVIARLPWSAIVTTNLDTLLEDAFDRPVVVSSEQDLSRIGLGHGPLVIKMHGTVADDAGQVLTRFEYQDFQQTRRAMQAVVLTLFSQFPVLVIGAGLTDQNFLSIYGTAESALQRYKRPTFYAGSEIPRFVAKVWNERGMVFLHVPHAQMSEWLVDLEKQVRAFQHSISARKARAALDRFLKEAALVSLGKDLGDYRALQQRYLEQVHIPDYGWFTEPWDSTLYMPLRNAMAKTLATLTPQQRSGWSLLYVAPGPHAPLFADAEEPQLSKLARDVSSVYVLDLLPGVVSTARDNVRERLESSAKVTGIIADLTGGAGDAACRLFYNLLEQNDRPEDILTQVQDTERLVSLILGPDDAPATASATAEALTTEEGSVNATVTYSEMVASFSLTAPIMSFRSALYQKYAPTVSTLLLQDIMAAVGRVWQQANDRMFKFHLEIMARATRVNGLVVIAMDTEKCFDDNAMPTVSSFTWSEPPPINGIPLARVPTLEASFMWRDHSAGFPVAIAGVPVVDFLAHQHQIRVLVYRRIEEPGAAA